MTAQQILKMIETVDPNDTAKLDEIAKEVSLYPGLKGYRVTRCGQIISFRGSGYGAPSCI